MRRVLVTMTILLMGLPIGAMLHAQTTQRSAPLPRVTLQLANPDFHHAIFPQWYATRNATHDFAWLVDNSLGLQAFWAIRGDSVLRALSQLSGLEWPGDSFSILLVRYFPSPGSADPCILPVGGIQTGQGIVAAPTGTEAELNLFRHLARRIVSSTMPIDLADHPAVRSGTLPQEQIVMHLAIATAREFNADTTIERALESPLWRTYWRGRELRSEYLSGWKLTPERPLLAYLREEPRTSDFSQAEWEKDHSPSGGTRAAIGGIPVGSELGLVISAEPGRRYLVRKVDPSRTAYSGGLRQGDRIALIDNARPTSERELMHLLLNGTGSGGCTIEIEREGKKRVISFKPKRGE